MEQEIIVAAFEYSQLDTETRIIVQQKASEIKTLMRRTAQDIKEIGHKLIEVKQQLGHGKFGNWLEAEFGWTDRTAQNFMRVADTFKSENFSDLALAPSALYLLASPSTPDEARQEAIERARQGEVVSRAVAREIVGGKEEERNGQTYTMNTAAIGQGRPMPRIMQVEEERPVKAAFVVPAAPARRPAWETEAEIARATAEALADPPAYEVRQHMQALVAAEMKIRKAGITIHNIYNTMTWRIGDGPAAETIGEQELLFMAAEIDETLPPPPTPIDTALRNAIANAIHAGPKADAKIERVFFHVSRPHIATAASYLDARETFEVYELVDAHSYPTANAVEGRYSGLPVSYVGHSYRLGNPKTLVYEGEAEAVDPLEVVVAKANALPPASRIKLTTWLGLAAGQYAKDDPPAAEFVEAIVGLLESGEEA